MENEQRVSQTPLPNWLDDALVSDLGNLRCTRRADRDRMVKELSRLAEHCGATISADPSLVHEGHSLNVYIRREPASVMVSLDGKSGNHRGRHNRDNGGVFLGHWNIMRGYPTRYAPYFGTLIGGSINPFHGQKATQGVQGFGHFMVSLAIALGAIMDGRAFLQQNSVT